MSGPVRPERWRVESTAAAARSVIENGPGHGRSTLRPVSYLGAPLIAEGVERLARFIREQAPAGGRR